MRVYLTFHIFLFLLNSYKPAAIITIKDIHTVMILYALNTFFYIDNKQFKMRLISITPFYSDQILGPSSLRSDTVRQFDRIS